MPDSTQGKIPVSRFHPADVVDAGLCVATLIPGTDPDAEASRDLAKAVILHVMYERPNVEPTREDLRLATDRFLGDGSNVKRLVIATREAPPQTEAVIIEMVTAFLALPEDRKGAILATARSGLRQGA